MPFVPAASTNCTSQRPIAIDQGTSFVTEDIVKNRRDLALEDFKTAEANDFIDCTDTAISHKGSIAFEGDVSIKWEEGELAVEGSACHLAMGDITCAKNFQVEHGGGATVRVNNSFYADSVKGNIRTKGPINFVSGQRQPQHLPVQLAPTVQPTPAALPVTQLAPEPPRPMPSSSNTQWFQNMLGPGTDTENRKKAAAFVGKVKPTPNDMFLSTAASSFASTATIHHDGSIDAEVLSSVSGLVNNSRTYFVAGNGIVNNKPITVRYCGSGSVVNDSSSVNICTGGNIVNNNPIKNVVRRPRN